MSLLPKPTGALEQFGIWENHHTAFQFRGVVYSASSDCTALVKVVGPDRNRRTPFSRLTDFLAVWSPCSSKLQAM